MKFTIEGFSQEAALSMQKEVKVKNSRGKEQTKILMLDQTDLTLLRWFVDFYPKMKKKIIGETQYAWVNYQSIVNDLPLLRIEKRSVYNRFSKMCELGILIHYHDKNGGSYSYYGFGEKYSLLIETNPMNSNSEGYESKYIGGMYSNSEGVCIQIPTKDSSINNSSINNYCSKKESKDAEYSNEPKSSRKTFNEIIDDYTENDELRKVLREHLKTRKLKRASLTNQAIILGLKKLDTLANTDEEKILIVQNSIMNGWTEFFALKKSEKRSKKRSHQSYNLDEFQNYSIFDDE